MTIREYEVQVATEPNIIRTFHIWAASRASAVRVTLPGLSLKEKQHLYKIEVKERAE